VSEEKKKYKIDMSKERWWTEEEIRQAAVEDWLGVLARLWTAIGKPIEAERLQLYREAFHGVPLGILEKAVERVIKGMVYQVVPLPGVVWEAIRTELGDPVDIDKAMKEWLDVRWVVLLGRITPKRGNNEELRTLPGAEAGGRLA